MSNTSGHGNPQEDESTSSALRRGTNYKKLRFYHRTDVLYQLTQVFCKRYFKKWGDRTVDQMVQAARSGKQNIVEASIDGKTSMESEIRLMGVARGSCGELLEDYLDYIKCFHVPLWQEGHPRYQPMLDFCRSHYKLEDYQQFIPKMDVEELANMAICLCHQVDAALEKFIDRLDKEFATEGGIRERMTAARLGQRETQKQTITRQQQEITALKQQIAALEQQIAHLKNQ